MKVRKGFTLVELLVVIGVMLILFALLTAGFRHVQSAAARRETLAELHVCRGMLQEYQNHNGLAGIEAYSNTSPLQQTDPNSPPNTPQKFPVFVDPAPSLNAANLTHVYSSQFTVPGSYWPRVGPPDVTDFYSDMGIGVARYSSPSVVKTRDVMYVLMHIPANRTTIQSIQSKRILEPENGTQPGTIDQGPIMLDGWGNPIIFVPRGGLLFYVTDYSQGTATKVLYVVRSTGIFSCVNGEPPMTGQEQPFWASAGPDGDFTQGEDNIYSFQD